MGVVAAEATCRLWQQVFLKVWPLASFTFLLNATENRKIRKDCRGGLSVPRVFRWQRLVWKMRQGGRRKWQGAWYVARSATFSHYLVDHLLVVLDLWLLFWDVGIRLVLEQAWRVVRHVTWSPQGHTQICDLYLLVIKLNWRLALRLIRAVVDVLRNLALDRFVAHGRLGLIVRIEAGLYRGHWLYDALVGRLEDWLDDYVLGGEVEVLGARERHFWLLELMLLRLIWDIIF